MHEAWSPLFQYTTYTMKCSDAKALADTCLDFSNQRWDGAPPAGLALVSQARERPGCHLVRAALSRADAYFSVRNLDPAADLN